MKSSNIEWQGRLAGANGKSLDACPYHRADRRNAWVRGWHEAQIQPRGELVQTVYSPHQQRQAKVALCGIRAILDRPERLPIEGECEAV